MNLAKRRHTRSREDLGVGNSPSRTEGIGHCRPPHQLGKISKRQCRRSPAAGVRIGIMQQNRTLHYILGT